MRPRMHFFLVLAIFAALSSSPAHAAETGETPAPTPRLRQEIAGIELAPLSVGTGSSALGVGVTLRLGRHRWPGFYWTPLQGGFFVSNGHFDETRMLKVQTEVGVVGRFNLGTIEAGLGVGPGLLGIEDKSHFCNEGPCGVGGEGVLFSPVVRFLLRERATHTVAAFVRAEIPAGATNGDSLVRLYGFGTAFLFGLDLAGGWD